MWHPIFGTSWLTLFLIASSWVGVTGLGTRARAQSWNDIGDYASLIRRAGTQTMVAKDCPSGLLGLSRWKERAVVVLQQPEQRSRQVTVLAHESAHVMQDCQKGSLLPDHQIADALVQIQRQSQNAIQELRLYHQSQRRDEIEARLVQGLPMAEVKALFRDFCADRLSGRSSDHSSTKGLDDG